MLLGDSVVSLREGLSIFHWDQVASEWRCLKRLQQNLGHIGYKVIQCTSAGQCRLFPLSGMYLGAQELMSTCKSVQDERFLQGKGKKSFESDKLSHCEGWILMLKEILVFRLELGRDIYFESNNSSVNFVSCSLNIKIFQCQRSWKSNPTH